MMNLFFALVFFPNLAFGCINRSFNKPHIFHVYPKIYEIDPFVCDLPPPHSLDYINPLTQVYTADNPSSPLSTVHNDADEAFNDMKNIITASARFSRVVFVSHGWTGDINTWWLHSIKDIILSERPDQIVVLISWKRGASAFHPDNPTAFYAQAAVNTQPTGQYIGSIAKKLKEHPETEHITIYGVGFSLGAHVMGAAGKSSDGAFTRVTGLDPAGPCFDVHNEDIRLSSSAAAFVDVIHSDGNPDSPSTAPYGTLAPLGHVDFYPNWGSRTQPGCSPWEDQEIVGCSHYRAVRFYLSSISNPGMFETREEITGRITYKSIEKTTEEIDGPPAEMGYYADAPGKTKTGSFYLETNADEPYGQ